MSETQAESVEQEIPVDLGDERQVKARNQRLDARRRGLAETLRKLMQTKDGRAWVHHMIYERLCYDRKIFTGNSATFANAGLLEAAQTLVRDLKALCFDQWALMEREALDSEGK